MRKMSLGKVIGRRAKVDAVFPNAETEGNSEEEDGDLYNFGSLRSVRKATGPDSAAATITKQIGGADPPQGRSTDGSSDRRFTEEDPPPGLEEDPLLKTRAGGEEDEEGVDDYASDDFEEENEDEQGLYFDELPAVAESCLREGLEGGGRDGGKGGKNCISGSTGSGKDGSMGSGKGLKGAEQAVVDDVAEEGGRLDHVSDVADKINGTADSEGAPGSTSDNDNDDGRGVQIAEVGQQISLPHYLSLPLTTSHYLPLPLTTTTTH
jgi:hypothetical protein